MMRSQLLCYVTITVSALILPGPLRAGGGPYMRMVPVSPQGVNAAPYPAGTTIDEEAGIISFPGTGPQRVWIEVRYGGWDAATDELRTYQFATVDLPVSTGGLLQKASEPCTTGEPGEDEFCRGLFGEGPPGESGCAVHGFGLCLMAFPQWVDGDYRDDYVPFDIFACNVATGRLRCGQTTGVGQGCFADDQTEKYSATIVVETTAAVGGPTDIPVDFDPNPVESFFTDCDTVLIPVASFTGAVIQFRAGACTSDDHCDDEDPCTNDTCNVGTGECAFTPIPGCPAASSPFTYQGLLQNPPGTPVTDLCDLRFGLWDAASGGDPIAVTFPHENPVTLLAVDVVGGVFNAILDYGPYVFNGDPRWLEIEVQCSGDASFVLLSPRVQVLPTPYALRALEGVGPPEGVYVSEAGDVGIGLSDPMHPIELASGAHVTDGGMWTNASSRSRKENFRDMSPLDVLSRLVGIPIELWKYENEGDEVRHLSPTAEDFYAAFGLGDSNAHIGTIDADGVSLAAIQGLHQIVQERECEVEELRARNRELEARLEQLEHALESLKPIANQEYER